MVYLVGSNENHCLEFNAHTRISAWIPYGRYYLAQWEQDIPYKAWLNLSVTTLSILSHKICESIHHRSNGIFKQVELLFCTLLLPKKSWTIRSHLRAPNICVGKHAPHPLGRCTWFTCTQSSPSGMNIFISQETVWNLGVGWLYSKIYLSLPCCPASKIYLLCSTNAPIMFRLCTPLCTTLTPFNKLVPLFYIAPVCGGAFTLTFLLPH